MRSGHRAPRFSVLCLALLCAGPSVADTEGAAPGVEVAAGLVCAAAEAADLDWMANLEQRDDPDPWLVVDYLCEGGAYADALLLARAASRPDTEGLAAYVRRLRDAAPAARARTKALRADVAHDRADANLPRGDTVPGLQVFVITAERARAAGRSEPAELMLLRAADHCVRLGWLAMEAYCLQLAVDFAWARKGLERVVTTLRRLDALEQRRGNTEGRITALMQLGQAHQEAERPEEAVARLEEAQGLARSAGLDSVVADVWRELAWVHASVHDHGAATEALGNALDARRALGVAEDVASATFDLGRLRAQAGEPEIALQTFEDVLEMRRRLEDDEGLSDVLQAMAAAYQELFLFDEAMERLQDSKRILESTNDRVAVARTIVRIGELHYARDEYPRALGMYEQAKSVFEEFQDDEELVRVLANIAAAQAKVSDFDAAKASFGQVLRLFDKRNDSEGLTKLLTRQSELCTLSPDGTLQCAMQALDVSRRTGNRASEAMALYHGAVAQLELGRIEEAGRGLEAALEIYEQTLQHKGEALARIHLGQVHRRQGRLAEALEAYKRGVDLAERLGLAGPAIRGRWWSAEVSLMRGDPQSAVQSIRGAVRSLPTVLKGSSETRGSVARESYSSMFALGLGAAIAIGSAADASYFVEAGRAGLFLEMLGNHKQVQDAMISPALKRAADRAQAKVVEAREVLQSARTTGRRKIIRFIRDRLKEAEAEEEEAVRRIQHEQKAIAEVMYPKPDELQVIQARLLAGDAMVLYGRSSRFDAETKAWPESYVALVIWPHATRLVELGLVGDVDDVLARFEPHDVTAPLADIEAQAEAVRGAMVLPLELGGDVQRVFVSPDGSASFAPLAMLFPGKDVCLVPSGTTLGVLRSGPRERGESVLALADPTYSRSAFGAEVLPSLPASREEAQAVGDELLLDKEATEARLRAALARNPKKRWRGVHLACHGQLNTEDPLRSALVVAPDDEHDGRLTAFEVFQMNVPSDCVSLSACETGLGKVVGGEGVVGLARGFMLAGAPRVVVSQWKVEDEATRALMVLFYSLWNPRDGSNSLPAATALRRAQEHVRRQPQWRHPYYWAAWVLWGLPD